MNERIAMGRPRMTQIDADSSLVLRRVDVGRGSETLPYNSARLRQPRLPHD